jgi:hypothetical protein
MSTVTQTTTVTPAVARRPPRRIPAVVWFLLIPGLALIVTLVSVIGLISARLAGASGAYVAFGEVLSVCLWILAGVAGISCAVGAWHSVLAVHKWVRTGLPPWKHE